MHSRVYGSTQLICMGVCSVIIRLLEVENGKLKKELQEEKVKKRYSVRCSDNFVLTTGRRYLDYVWRALD